jgi:P4 family phage/plasmid primase-like protien
MEPGKDNACNALFEFMNEFRALKRSTLTHTIIGNPGGSFYIPRERQYIFYQLYIAAMANGASLGITEKHDVFSPVLLDFDFRHEPKQNLDVTDKKQRRYRIGDISRVCRWYLTLMSQYVQVPDTVKIYIMEKSKPSYISKTHQIKDGIHIMIPDVVTRPAIQYMVRNDLLKHSELRKLVASKWECVNSPEDVFDEKVIETNNWLMYGSGKPDSEPYRVTSILEYHKLDFETKAPKPTIYQLDPPKDQDHVELVTVLSIRNKFTETPIANDMVSEIEQFEIALHDGREKKRQITAATQKSRNNTSNEVDNVGLVERLVEILHPDRAEQYDEWVRLGWCLRNIDHRLLPLWISFSKRSPKFVDGECERLWNHMRADGLGIGTLHMWAKHDNQRAYEEVIRNDLFSLICASTSMTHTDIARVIHHIFQHQFVCASIKNKAWFYFHNHRWRIDEHGHTLAMKISTDVFREYVNVQSKFNEMAVLEQDAVRSAEYAKKALIMNQIGVKLKTAGFKAALMSECSNLFYMDKFEETLDSRCNILCFENGVFDMDLMEFRDGRPEDMVSYTTGINYVEVSHTDPVIYEINDFIGKVLTDVAVRDYIMKRIGSALHGANRDENFDIWEGCGGNGKSKMLELISKSLGDYCCNMNVTAVTGKRVASNSTNSELVRAKGRRLLILQEPGEDEKMNIGYVKELTGGDKVVCRGLFKEPIEFKPQFKMILVCNHLPEVPANDGGAWRRIRRTVFSSLFTDSPNPSVKTEFMIDMDLSNKFEEWKEAFVVLLIGYYQRYKDEGNKAPDAVIKSTMEYQRRNDAICDFLEEAVVTHVGGFLPATSLFNEFKAWVRDNRPGYKAEKKTLTEYCVKKYGPIGKFKTYTGWKEYALASVVREPEEDE